MYIMTFMYIQNVCITANINSAIYMYLSSKQLIAIYS